MATFLGDSAGSLTDAQKRRRRILVGTDSHAKGGRDALIGGINTECRRVSNDPRGDAVTTSGSASGSDVGYDEWKLRAVAESW